VTILFQLLRINKKRERESGWGRGSEHGRLETVILAFICGARKARRKLSERCMFPE
jgi:hypothetical protein